MANQIIHSGVIVGANIVAGANTILSTSEESVPSSEKSMEVTVQFKNLLPDVNVIGTLRYGISMILEEELSPGNWIPFATQNEPYRDADSSERAIKISYGPDIDNEFSERPYDMVVAGKTVLQEYKIEGNIPAKFRVCLIVNSDVDNLDPAVFQSVEAVISYETFA